MKITIENQKIYQRIQGVLFYHSQPVDLQRAGLAARPPTELALPEQHLRVQAESTEPLLARAARGEGVTARGTERDLQQHLPDRLLAVQRESVPAARVLILLRLFQIELAVTDKPGIRSLQMPQEEGKLLT